MRCWRTPDLRASDSVRCRRGWWSTTSWLWRCMVRRPTARCCAACWKACAGCIGTSLVFATKCSITKARRRLGPAPVAELYRRVARPLAEPGLPGCFFRGRRLVSLDGTTIDLPDAPDLVTRFGRPAASRGESAFPQLRLMALAETGTHAVFAAAFDHIDIGETTLARRLLDHLRPGMLCLADRAFVGFELWTAARATGADLLWRLRVNQVLPCDEMLPDGSYLSQVYP